MAQTSENGGNLRTAIRHMADADPDLAARLIVQGLPAAAAGLPGPLRYGLAIDGVGSYVVDVNGGEAAVVSPAPDGVNGNLDLTLRTDARTLAELAGGASPLRKALTGKLKLSGSRRKALALRGLSTDAGVRDLARLGAPIDPDLVFRALPYAIDPEWTRGHRFCIEFRLLGEGGGSWFIDVADGEVGVTREAPREPDSIAEVSLEDWLAVLSGELSPTVAIQQARSVVIGELHPQTLLFRWMDRAEGRDGPELEREARQREVQRRRSGTWGSSTNGKPAVARGDLLDYQQLYALWERQNWSVHELDFSVDQQHWLTVPSEAQADFGFVMGNFYVAEERVAADLAPFVLAAPSGEVEAFLATQLVDETRHAVFFDRFMAEVMALSADDLRGRLAEMHSVLPEAWYDAFDNGLRDTANQLKQRPDDLALFVRGITLYHLLLEGILAMTGQRTILEYLEAHSVFPGFYKGFSFVERDEHRHIAFGVRFLRDVCRERPEMRGVVEGTVMELGPRVTRAMVPHYAEDPSDYMAYGNHSSQLYGAAYLGLRGRMKVIGLEAPPPEELFPGPVDLKGVPAQQVN